MPFGAAWVVASAEFHGHLHPTCYNVAFRCHLSAGLHLRVGEAGHVGRHQRGQRPGRLGIAETMLLTPRKEQKRGRLLGPPAGKAGFFVPLLPWESLGITLPRKEQFHLRFAEVLLKIGRSETVCALKCML